VDEEKFASLITDAFFPWYFRGAHPPLSPV